MNCRHYCFLFLEFCIGSLHLPTSCRVVLLFITSICSYLSNLISLLGSFARITLHLAQLSSWNLTGCCSTNMMADIPEGLVEVSSCTACRLRIFGSAEVTEKTSFSLSKMSVSSPTACIVALFLLGCCRLGHKMLLFLTDLGIVAYRLHILFLSCMPLPAIPALEPGDTRPGTDQKPALPLAWLVPHGEVTLSGPSNHEE